MATVLVSFIGTGQKNNNSSKSGYREANYLFAKENNVASEEITTTIFGSALIKRMNNIKRPVDSWLIMGTQKSIWDSLIDILTEEQQERVLEIWGKVSEYVENKNGQAIIQEILNEWEVSLSKETQRTRIFCRLVGEMDSSESQQLVYKALFETIGDNDEIIFDITHGLRHQPVLASFMIMLLRWLKNIKSVDMYYGAFELKGDNSYCPVLKLPLANKLLQSTEAVAIFEQTGNYRKLGEALELSQATNEHLEKLFFGDEMHKTKIGAAQNIKKEVKEKEDTFNQIELELAKKLESSLEWESESHLSKRWKTKAVFEFDRQQYFKAIAWLWEAVLIAACEQFSIPNPLKHDSREIAEKTLKDKLNQSQLDVFWTLKNLRNAVLHGSESQSDEVKRATESINEFSKVFGNALRLFDEIRKLQL